MWFALAVGAAVCFGIRGILYHWSSRQAMDRDLMLAGGFAAGTAICLALSLAFDQPWTGPSRAAC